MARMDLMSASSVVMPPNKILGIIFSHNITFPDILVKPDRKMDWRRLLNDVYRISQTSQTDRKEAERVTREKK